MTETRASTLVRDHIDQVVSKAASFGIPCLDLPSAKPHLGVSERGDIGLPSFQAGMEKIYQEGKNLRALETISISATASFEVFSTIAASPHTVFAVPYSEFASQWQKTIALHPEFFGNTETVFIEGTEDGHAKNAPAQLITWVMLKKISPTDPRGYELVPVDVFDFATAIKEYDEKSRLKEAAGCRINEQIFMDLYQSVKKHMDMHTEFLGGLFDSYAKDRINERLREIGIEAGSKDIWDIQNTMVVGHYRGHIDDDGKGGGPQSHPTFHTHTVAYPDLNEIRRRIVQNVMAPPYRVSDFRTIESTPVFDPEILYKIASLLRQKKDITHEQIAAIINTDITVITNILENTYGWTGNRNMDEEAVREALITKADQINITLNEFQALFKAPVPPILGNINFSDPDCSNPEAMFKQIDPYAAVFFKIMGQNIMDQLQRRFGPLGASIGMFGHSSEKDGFDMRTSEGWSIACPSDSFETYNLALNDFFDHMRHLWTDSEAAWKHWYLSQEENSLLALQANYGLPHDAIAVIKQVLPTSKQLERWIAQEEMDDFQRLRLVGKFEVRKDPLFLQRIARRLTNGGTLEERTYLFGLLQLLDDSYIREDDESKPIPFNKGYNIPGLPSFGITYVKTQGRYTIRICPIMGLRAMAEENIGTTVNRLPGII